MVMEEACLQAISQAVMRHIHNSTNAILQTLRDLLCKLWEYKMKRWKESSELDIKGRKERKYQSRKYEVNRITRSNKKHWLNDWKQ